MHKNIKNPLPFIGLALLLGGAGVACKEAQAKVKGPGDSLKAFVIKNCASGERYCQVCAYSGKPTIMAVGVMGDKDFEKDLVEINKLVKANEAKGLTAFALYGEIKEGKFVAVADEAAAEKTLAATHARLGLKFPITLAPAKLEEKEAKSYKPFTELYEVNKSRTVMVAKASNEIVWADTLAGKDAQYKAMAAAVGKAL